MAVCGLFSPQFSGIANAGLKPLPPRLRTLQQRLGAELMKWSVLEAMIAFASPRLPLRRGARLAPGQVLDDGFDDDDVTPKVDAGRLADAD